MVQVAASPAEMARSRCSFLSLIRCGWLHLDRATQQMLVSPRLRHLRGQGGDLDRTALGLVYWHDFFWDPRPLRLSIDKQAHAGSYRRRPGLAGRNAIARVPAWAGRNYRHVSVLLCGLSLYSSQRWRTRLRRQTQTASSATAMLLEPSSVLFPSFYLPPLLHYVAGKKITSKLLVRHTRYQGSWGGAAFA